MRADAEGTLAIFASLLVLLTAMLDPVISAGLAMALLAATGISKLVRRRRA